MTIAAPFGRMITAMVTPFDKDGAIDWDGVARLAQHLLDNGHDGIAVNGTTGEAPTTKSSEKLEIIKVVKSVVGSKITFSLSCRRSSYCCTWRHLRNWSKHDCFRARRQTVNC